MPIIISLLAIFLSFLVNLKPIIFTNCNSINLVNNQNKKCFNDKYKKDKNKTLAS